MKPIKLTIAGLNSFREKQEIDFETLCSGGVFGIFGPTGSGKSSILDAMTLALYGKVERAANHTQGIMNHAENQLSVSFTFELESGEQKKRYRVERSFKRVDEIRVKTAVCRLLEEGEETVVLADKANEVNEKIHHLLGLTIDDFTRAVVLPQGKFAEFLSLKGSDRRQMLQRLFNLEQYGDALTKKLKIRLQQAKMTLQERLAEQTGLGDASKEAIEAQKEAVEESQKLLYEMEKEFEVVTKAFEEKQQIWNLQIEKETLFNKQKQLDQEKTNYEELENLLKIAEEADRLKPYAKAVKDLREEKERYETQTKQLEKETKTKKDIHDEKKKTFEKIRVEKANNEPKLLQKQEKLYQLIEIVDDLEKEIEGLNKLNHEYDDLQKILQNKQEEIQKIEDLLKRAIFKQTELKNQLKENTVSKEIRETIQLAFQKKQELKQHISQLKEYEELSERKSTHLKEIEQKMIESNKKHPQIEKQLTDKFHSLQQLYNLVSDRYREFAAFQHQMKRMILTVRNQIEDARTHEVAKQLVEKLVDGKPCPVCGSTHHPSPQKVEQSNERTNLEQKLLTLEHHVDQIQKEEQQLYTLKLKLEELSEMMISEQPFLKETHHLTAAAVEPILNLDDEWENVNVNEVIQQVVTETKALNQDYIEIKEKLNDLNQQIRNIKQTESQLDPIKQSLQKDLDEAKEAKQKIYERIEKENQEWQIKFPNLKMEEVEEAVQNLKEKDAIVEDLTNRIETSVTFIEEREKMKQKLKEEEFALSNQLSEIKAKRDHKQQIVQDKEHRLKKENMDKEKLNMELEDIKNKLQYYKIEEQKAYEQWQIASNELKQLESQFYTAREQWKETSSKLQKAEEVWEEEKENSSLNSIEDVFEAIIPKEQKQKWQEKLVKYQEEVYEIKTALQQVIEKLNDRSLTEEEWIAIQAKKQDVKLRLNEAVAQKGAAETQLNHLLEKHKRFMEIEDQKKILEKDIEHLEKLQSVFKGNSFVEYIAEEQLEKVSIDASERLGELTRRRYTIEVDSQGGFIIRDDANGGMKRPVSSLSGGETFLTSLALALSLSAQIQLRGQYPLQFFFLDEGFGTLDAELLDTVVTALEKLQSQNLSVGVISHVQELRARLPRRLVVEPAEPSGRGSRVKIETL